VILGDNFLLFRDGEEPGVRDLNAGGCRGIKPNGQGNLALCPNAARSDEGTNGRTPTSTTCTGCHFGPVWTGFETMDGEKVERARRMVIGQSGLQTTANVPR
jgi:hypothetical protein